MMPFSLLAATLLVVRLHAAVVEEVCAAGGSMSGGGPSCARPVAAIEVPGLSLMQTSARAHFRKATRGRHSRASSATAVKAASAALEDAMEAMGATALCTDKTDN